MIIRMAKDEDLDQIIDIWERGVNSIGTGAKVTVESKDKFRSNFNTREGFYFWVVEKEEKIIGYQSYTPLTNNPISKLIFEGSTYIDEEYRHFGYAFRVIKYSLDRLKEFGPMIIFGFVKPENVEFLKILKKVNLKVLGNIPPVKHLSEKVVLYYLVE